MAVKEHLIKEIDGLDEDQLQELEDFLFFLKFCSRISRSSRVREEDITRLYAEFSGEDRAMVEETIDDYVPGLLKEDKL